MRPRALASLALAAATFASSGLAQQHPNIERGIAPGKAFQVGDLDTVSLYNGAMSLSIPIGSAYPVGADFSYALTLNYTSSLWDIFIDEVNWCQWPFGPFDLTVADADPDFNAGLGWMLWFGGLKPLGDGTNDDPWVYTAADGGEHRFVNTLHEGETATAGKKYSRTGTYYRLTLSNLAPTGCSFSAPAYLQAVVELPDGTMQTFTRPTPCQTFTLASISDRFGNALNITYLTNPDRWVLQDSHGRQHTITFMTVLAVYRVVQYVDLETASGTARYSFSYDTTRTIARSCKHERSPTTCPNLAQPPEITVPLLTGVLLPDGSSWSMMNGTEPGYNLDRAGRCSEPNFPQDQPGTLTNLTAPTGGGFQWAYGIWANPPGSSSCYFSEDEYAIVKTSTGVTEKKIMDASDAEVGKWTYTHDSWRLGDDTVDPDSQESWTIVKSPTPESDETKHYFRTRFCLGASPQEGWDYGLPFTRGRYGTDASPYKSAETYDGTVATGTLKRTTYATYDHDTLYLDGGNPPFNGQWLWHNSNRRANFGKTIYNDDASHWSTVSRSSFDGLAHYRTEVADGDFPPSQARTTTTNFNPSAGTYPGSFTLPAPASPWIITTYDYQQQAQGGVTAKQEYCFASANGSLQRTRTLKTGTSRNAADLVSVFTRDTTGNLTREEHYGGDTQSVSTAGALCTMTLPSCGTYRLDHGYQYGVRNTSRYADMAGCAGTPMSFYALELDIDQSTGLPSASYQASTGTRGQGGYVAGIKTTYQYDASGRLTWEKPDAGHGAWAQYVYTTASGVAPARATILQRANGSESGTILAGRELEFDFLGRMVKEKQLLPGQTWPPSGACMTQCNQRVTGYNALGLKISLSEWQAYNPTTVYATQYLNFDPFGRPTTIRPPDGSAHDVTLAYTGVRLTDRTVKIATAQGSETSVTSSEEYDWQGRLSKVKEYSDPANPTTYVTTTYTYDVGNRLKQAATTSGVTQNRVFTYDNRGFLLSEQLPEKGTSGNGTVTYSNYDARGHALRIQDGPSDLTFAFDRAERLTQVAQADASGNPGTPVLTTLAYATTNNGSDKRNGKLLTATSANPDLASASVVETYTYGGPSGRVSARQTVVEGRTINQSFTWNDLGLLWWQGYPNDSVLADAVEPPRQVINTYSNGLLTGVCEGSSPPNCATNYITGISYYSNGMVNQITHANATKVVHGKDPNDMARPASISLQRTADSSVLWQTGTYGYDGAGNIKAIGSDWYIYDLVNRLKVGTTMGATKQQCARFNAFGTIDGLGTGTMTCSPSTISVDAATNRMSLPVTYDAAGSMTAWGGNIHSWNRLSQMLTTTGTGFNRSYAYTVDAERAVDRNNQDSTRTLWIRDLSGKVLREYSRSGAGAWSWSKDYIYRNGLHAATVTASTTRHFALDHLGTLRRGTDTQATPQLDATLTRDFYPFGLEATSATGAERMRFTGHQRDTFGTTAQTDDLDYLHARYYNPNVARFLSVDPVRGTPKSPQSWNLYSYVQNNPINKTDPDGKAALLVATTNYEALNSALKDALTPVLGTSLANKVATVLVPKNPADAMTTAALSLAGPLAVTTTAAKGGTALLTQAARKLGQEGEAAVRQAVDIGPKVAIQVAGRARVPDGLTATVLNEVKNVKSLSFTLQLRDYASFATDTSRSFQLWVRPTTELSGPLMDAIEAGVVNRNLIP